MKIKMYEVRNDELDSIKKYAQAYNIEVETSQNNLDSHTVQELNGVDGVSILGRSNITPEIVDALKQAGVHFLSTRTVGFNHIDLNYAKSAGLRICNANYPPNGVAEFTVMLMLLALRKYKPAMWRQGVNDYSLNGLLGKELGTMTVGVIGTGKIGQAVIKILGGFGCKILAYDPYPSDAVKSMAEYVSLDTLLGSSDIITLHVPLTDGSRALINADSISKMKKGVVIVNASRGELTDIEALTSGIETEQIGAVAMDVFANENGIYHQSRINDIIKNRQMAYFRQFPNVVLTQHMAFYTDINTDSMVRCGISGLVDMYEGRDCECEL